MFDKTLFCNNLKKLRLMKNLTLEQLGGSFGVTKQTISRWENGTRLPTLDVVVSLADYFNVSLDYLVGRDFPKTDK